MPLRLLGYMTAIWRTYAADNPGKPLPAILPVVVAQCEGPWPVAKDFPSLLDIPPRRCGISAADAATLYWGEFEIGNAK